MITMSQRSCDQVDRLTTDLRQLALLEKVSRRRAAALLSGRRGVAACTSPLQRRNHRRHHRRYPASVDGVVVASADNIPDKVAADSKLSSRCSSSSGGSYSLESDEEEGGDCESSCAPAAHVYSDFYERRDDRQTDAQSLKTHP